MIKKKLTEARLKKFVDSAMLDVYTSGGKLRSVGVKRGYMKPLATRGFKRPEVIRILNHLQDNPTKAKRLIKY